MQADQTVKKVLEDLRKNGGGIAKLTQTWNDENGNFYRVYSDGFIIQGGSSAKGTVSLMKEFSNENYKVVCNGIGASSNGTSTTVVSFVSELANIQSKKKSSFAFADVGFGVPNSCNWIAAGF